MTRRVGPFLLLEELGRGGMGVVHAALDERLGRRVAVKMPHAEAESPEARKRLWREARAAAAVQHRNVCQVLDVGEDEGAVWIAMELLEGEPLSVRLARGPLPPAHASRVALGMLDALDAMHRRGVVHRDLKPSNVFLTAGRDGEGVKLLDFGLARETHGASGADRLTATGALLGTPGFIAPEQLSGGSAGPPADFFAFGAILFEMLTARPAFAGATVVDVCHAVLHAHPPALVGGPGVEVLDLVLQRALAKRPEDRPVVAELAAAVRAAAERTTTDDAPMVRTMTRLVVLPLRVLRSDPDAEFLSHAVADALVASLQRLPSIVVRSSHAVAKWAGPPPDLEALSSRAQVDLVLLGTLAVADERVRVSAQLVEAPGGAVVRSESVEVAGKDLFKLQDELGRRLADALAPPLVERGGSTQGVDVPATPRVYELYLRATQLSTSRAMWPDALSLLQQCVAEDPHYAPAWARLGRQHRVMAKYGHGNADTNLRAAGEALSRAISLNADLGLAHLQLAAYEIEERGHALEAMVRLLGHARRHPSNPDLFGGPVLACRFCGLIEASLAADQRARRLDPGVSTSVAYTWWAAGKPERAMHMDDQDWCWLRMYALPLLGRDADAVQICDEALATGPKSTERCMVTIQRAALLRDRGACAQAARAPELDAFHDPEGRYFIARALLRVGEIDAALELLDRAVDGGFSCGALFALDPWLEPALTSGRFALARERADVRRSAALAAFVAEGGPILLGVPGG